MKFSIEDVQNTSFDNLSGTKSDLLKLSLTKFYTNPQNIKPFKDIVTQQHRISLRLIDWFVTNYSKQHNIIIPNAINNCNESIHINNSYKQQLRSYGKQLFDPFRRDYKLTFIYGNTESDSVETSLGQMNIFKWLIQYKIIDFIEANIDVIEKDMINTKKNISCSFYHKLVLPHSIQASQHSRLISFE